MGERLLPAQSSALAIPENSTPQNHPYRWIMLAGVWLVYACFGLTAAAMAPLVKIITQELQISLSAMGGILGAWPLVYIGAAIPAGTLLDRFGLRRSLFAATILIALSAGLRASAWDGPSLFIAVAVFGLGGPLVSSGAPKLISQWFSGQERGTAMGIYITGPAIGGILALTLTNSVMMPLLGGNWRWVLLSYAGLTLLVGIVWLFINAHPGSKAQAVSAAGDNNKFDWAVYPQLLCNPVIRIVLLISVGVFMFNHGLNNWLPEILRAGGMDEVQAGYWAAVPTAVGIAAALIIPRLAVPSRRIRVLLGLFASAGLAVFLLATSTGVLQALALVFQGITRTTMMTVTMLVLMDARGISGQNMGAASGLFFTAAEIGGVLGPLLLGIIADLSGGFTLPLFMLCGLCGLLAMLTLYLRAELAKSGAP